ncbi:unnamed protein product [Allacma fusca]|uniref:Carboxylic ester hydrolase n=1 Tax=Allacma fusca TaxID=39272 RepID=A0A8J2M7S7_9HEXA|nr:unnamed protein product [Allacma fusca]
MGSRSEKLIKLRLVIITVFCFSSGLTRVEGQAGERTAIQVGSATLEGTRHTLDRRNYYSFQGIPYAHPPTGDKRWEEPVLAELYGNVKATAVGDRCPQWNPTANRSSGSENCLFLNVYTPIVPSQRPASVNARSLLPVMVYIHGGGFSAGGGDVVGPRKFMKLDVVLVTFNYRLGLLGFLSTGDEILPGNYGLLDQIAALEWVKQNIRSFGGNPESVTIFGDSAGAASVNFLMLSPRATSLKLFHRAIMQSGSALCDWAVEPNPREFADIIAEELECSGNSEDIRTCLKEKTPEELVKAQQSTIKTWAFPIRTAPVVDIEARGEGKALLPDTPSNLMDAGAYAQIPVIAGVNHDEGLMGYSSIHLEHGVENMKNQEYLEGTVVPQIVEHFFHAQGDSEAVTKAVLQHYFEGVNVSTTQGMKLAIAELTELIGDTAINSCNFNLLEKFAATKQALTFSYVFTHKTAKSPSIIAKNIQDLRTQHVHHPLFNYGVSHSDELFYLFEPVNIYHGNLHAVMYPEDLKVSDILTKIWVGFATHGNPASAVQNLNLQPWRPVGVGNINYYNLTSVSAPMGSDFRKGEAMFWLRTVPYIRELGETIDSLSCYPLLFYIFLGLVKRSSCKDRMSHHPLTNIFGFKFNPKPKLGFVSSSLCSKTIFI